MSDFTPYTEMLEAVGLQVIRAVKVPSGSPDHSLYSFSVEGRGGIKAHAKVVVSGEDVEQMEGLPPMYSFSKEEQKIVLTDNLPASKPKKAMALQRIRKTVTDAVNNKEYISATEAVNKAFDLGTAKLYMGKEKPRRYIGASHIGNPCIAYNTLCARGFPGDTTTPKQTRIFQAGHIIEDEVVKTLQAGGLSISPVKDDGQQHEYTALGGHLVCHLDGIVDGGNGNYAVLEVKSMNKTRFQKFVRYGVKISDPHYYAQLQLCMHLSGFKHALFVSYCKDNSEFHNEIVPYDEATALELVDRAKKALTTRKLERTENEFFCRFCFKRGACKEEKLNQINTCAQCLHADAVLEGEGKRWECDVHGKIVEGDKLACPNFVALNGLIVNM